MDGLAIAVVAAGLILLGRFLDGPRWTGVTRDRFRAALISLYAFLDSYRARMTRSIADLFDAAYERPMSDAPQRSARAKWMSRLFYLVWIPAFSIGFAYLAQYVFKENTANAIEFGITHDGAWWCGLLGGIALAFTGPAVLACIVLIPSVALLVPVIVILAILGITRRLLLLFGRSSSPATSPFSYFCTLLAVMTVAIALI